MVIRFRKHINNTSTATSYHVIAGYMTLLSNAPADLGMALVYYGLSHSLLIPVDWVVWHDTDNQPIQFLPMINFNTSDIKCVYLGTSP